MSVALGIYGSKIQLLETSKINLDKYCKWRCMNLLQLWQYKRQNDLLYYIFFYLFITPVVIQEGEPS